METTGERSVALADTFPKLLLDHLRKSARSAGDSEKDFGIWQSWTWANTPPSAACLRLAAKGFKRGDKLGIIGDNRPRSIGPPLPPRLWGHPGSRCIRTRWPRKWCSSSTTRKSASWWWKTEQVDKLLEMKERIPRVQLIIYDERGLGHYDFPFLDSYEEIQGLGKIFDQEHPDFFLRKSPGSGSDIATILIPRAPPPRWC